LVFSEPLSNASAEQEDNYHLDNGVNVIFAEQDPVDSSVVYLSVENLVVGELSLLVDGCEDFAGNMVNDSVGLYSPFSNIGLEEEVQFDFNLYSIDGKVYFNSINDCHY